MWKYKQVTVDQNASLENRQEILDQLGSDGWELKTTHKFGARSEILVFAKQVTEEEKAAPIPSPGSKTLLG
jgi:hypothetical protein